MLEKRETRFVDFKVLPVEETGNNNFEYAVILIYPDGSQIIQKKQGFKTLVEAQEKRDKTVGELYLGTYIVKEEVSVREFFTSWLEDVMKKRIAHNSYTSYANIIKKHIIPFFEEREISMENIKMAHVQSLYKEKAEFSHEIAKLTKTVMNTAMEYAKKNNIISNNPAREVKLPKCIKKKSCKSETH